MHGVGGIIGALLTGVFAYGAALGHRRAARWQLGQPGAALDPVPGRHRHVGLQRRGTLILLMVTKMLVGLRVGEEEEREGLDLVLHGEQIF